VHRLDRFASLRSAAHVWLVCDYDQDEVRCFQPRATGCYVFVKFEFLEANWRIWPAIPNHRAIKHSVAIKENGAPRYFMLSHFVGATFKSG
jgi:hypothetical protein